MSPGASLLLLCLTRIHVHTHTHTHLDIHIYVHTFRHTQSHAHTHRRTHLFTLSGLDTMISKVCKAWRRWSEVFTHVYMCKQWSEWMTETSSLVIYLMGVASLHFFLSAQQLTERPYCPPVVTVYWIWWEWAGWGLCNRSVGHLVMRMMVALEDQHSGLDSEQFI